MTMHMKNSPDREGWRLGTGMEKQRGGKGMVYKRRRDKVVVSADGWAGGFPATYSAMGNRWGLINPEREALPAQVTKQPQLSQGSGFIVN